METEVSEQIAAGESLAKMGDNIPRVLLSFSWFTWLAPGLVGTEPLDGTVASASPLLLRSLATLLVQISTSPDIFLTLIYQKDKTRKV